MKVVIHDSVRKTSNKIRLLSTLILLPTTFIAIILNFEFAILDFSILEIALILFLTILITLLINLFHKPSIHLEELGNCILVLNSQSPIRKIKNVHDIEYSKNYLLRNNINEVVCELDRKQAFKLLNSCHFDQSNVKIKYRPLSFFELNPNGLIRYIWEMVGNGF